MRSVLSTEARLPSKTTLSPLDTYGRPVAFSWKTSRLPSPPNRSHGKRLHSLLTLLRTIWGRGAGGEGALLAASPLDRILDSLTHSERISQNLVPRDSQHFIAEVTEVLIASLITLSALFLEMMRAVHLDNQLDCDAAEVHGVGTDSVFTAKLLATTTTVANHLPYIVGKLVGHHTLISRKRDGFRGSSSLCHTELPPHPQPLSPSKPSGLERSLYRATTPLPNQLQWYTWLVWGRGEQERTKDPSAILYLVLGQQPERRTAVTLW